MRNEDVYGESPTHLSNLWEHSKGVADTCDMNTEG
jgi:hypothetical protein